MNARRILQELRIARSDRKPGARVHAYRDLFNRRCWEVVDTSPDGKRGVLLAGPYFDRDEAERARLTFLMPVIHNLFWMRSQD